MPAKITVYALSRKQTVFHLKTFFGGTHTERACYSPPGVCWVYFFTLVPSADRADLGLKCFCAHIHGGSFKVVCDFVKLLTPGINKVCAI